jgi:hypothetical protein
MASRLIVTLVLVGSCCVSLTTAFMPAACTSLGQNSFALRQTGAAQCRETRMRRELGSKSLRLSASASADPESMETNRLAETSRRGFLSVVAAGFLSANAAAYAAEDKGEGTKGGQTSTTSTSGGGSGEQGSTTLGCDTPKPKPGEPEVCETDY